MPFDGAGHKRGYRVRLKSARLNVGLPVPELQWPTNLFRNGVGQRDLASDSVIVGAWTVPPRHADNRIKRPAAGSGLYP